MVRGSIYDADHLACCAQFSLKRDSPPKSVRKLNFFTGRSLGNGSVSLSNGGGATKIIAFVRRSSTDTLVSVAPLASSQQPLEIKARSEPSFIVSAAVRHPVVRLGRSARGLFVTALYGYGIPVELTLRRILMAASVSQ